MKIAYRQQRAYFPGLGPPKSDRCPHCGRPDSGGHILGGCMKPTFKAMYIHRQLAMRPTLKAISKENHGGYHTIADIGRAELIEDMRVNAKRIPTWLLPNSCLLVAGLEPTDRHKIRPDIMLTEMTHLELMRCNAEGMEHPELSTTISGQRPLGSRDGTEARRRKV